MALFGLFKNKKAEEPAIKAEPQPIPAVKEAIICDDDTEDIVEAIADYDEEDDIEGAYDEDEDDLWDPIDIDDSVDPAEAEAMFQEAMALYKEADRQPNSDDAPSLLADAYARMEQAAMAGHVKAMFYAGMMCRACVGYDDDGYGGDGMAADWFQVAANRGHREAQYLLGVFYENDPDHDSGGEARKWLTAAAKQGHLDAREALKKHR